MPVPVRSVLTAFVDVEEQLRVFLDRVPFVPEHDKVWSPALASCLLEACSQLDSFWKASAQQPAQAELSIRDHFRNFGPSVAGRWLVVWGDEGRELSPFDAWTSGDYEPTTWWQAYNAIKHDRWANIRQATLENAANALGGLFLAIIRCAECLDLLVERGWFHSPLIVDQTFLTLYRRSEDPELGATMESNLFSYASGSGHSAFEDNLVEFRNCTHRFARWLEKKYKRRVAFT